MSAGIYFIVFGIVVVVIGVRWADNMANNFRKFGPKIDPAYLKVAIAVAGLAGIIFGIVKLTAAPR